MKNIIKRIIVGVAIGMILYFLKGIAFINVQALEYKKCPYETNGFFFYNNQDNVRNDRDLLYGQINGVNLFYRSFGNATSRDQIGFRFSAFDYSINNATVQFVFYDSGLVSPYSIPYQAFIRDTSSNKYYSCFSDSSGTYSSSTSTANYTSPWNAFYCPNVSFNSSFELIVTSGFNSPQSNSTMGITCLTITTDNDQDLLQEQNDKIDETNNQLQDMNDTINSDDTTESEDEATSFFEDFENEDHGLTGIITAPLRLINSLASSSCSPLTFPLPFVDTQVSLPCMQPIYQQHFSSFLSIYQIITTGLIGYWISVKIFAHVKGFKNPEEDKVEVLDL